MEGGTAVLLNDLGAYWVKDGKVYALNGLAASYSPGLEYGPAGIGIETVRKALGRPDAAQVAPKSMAPPSGSWKNPTMGDLHKILAPSSFLVGEFGENMAWQKGDTAIYFEVEGVGNGQIAREIRVLTLFKNGKEIWSSSKVKIEDNVIYILTKDQKWVQVP